MRKLSDVIEDIGVGAGTVKLLLLAGGVYVTNGAFVYGVSVLAPSLAEELDISVYKRSLLFSAIYVGKLLGNVFSGVMDRNYGRKPLIVCLYAGCAASCLLSALAHSFEVVFLLWTICGCVLGIGVPSWNSLVTEAVPSSWRLPVNSFSMFLYTVATFLVSGLCYYFAPDLKSLGADWRMVMALQTVPTLVLLLLVQILGFPESPQWLATRGRITEAEEAVQAMAFANGREDIPLEFDLQEFAPEQSSQSAKDSSVMDEIWMLFSRELRGTTAFIIVSTFVLNFVYAGFAYSLPLVVNDLGLNVSPVIFLALTNLMEAVGYALGIATSPCFSRKSLILAYLVGTNASIFMFICDMPFLVAAGTFGSRILTCLGFLVLYTVCGEAYPTKCRTAGSGFCMASGRIGSIICPFVFEHMQVVFGSNLPYFQLMIMLCTFNAAISFMWQPRAGDADEGTPLKV